MQIFFEKREELTPGIWQYYFRPERALDFVAGQYVTVHLDVNDDERGPSRVFTLTSLPSDELLSFVLKMPKPPSVYKQALAGLEIGESAKIDDAMGDLILPKVKSLPLVFVAGGIGIASFIGMLKQLLNQREERSIFLFYALQDRREQIFRDILTSYPLELKTVVIKPNRLTAQQIQDSTPPDAQVYISGSLKFVEGLRTDLERIGTARANIVFDYYEGYTDL